MARGVERRVRRRRVARGMSDRRRIVLRRRLDEQGGGGGTRRARRRGGSGRPSGCNRTGRRRARFPATRGSWTRRGTSRGSICRRRPARWRSASMRRAGDEPSTASGRSCRRCRVCPNGGRTPVPGTGRRRRSPRSTPQRASCHRQAGQAPPGAGVPRCPRGDRRPRPRRPGRSYRHGQGHDPQDRLGQGMTGAVFTGLCPFHADFGFVDRLGRAPVRRTGAQTAPTGRAHLHETARGGYSRPHRPARPGPETFGTARNRRRYPRIRRTLFSSRRPHVMRRTLDAGY